MKKIGLISDTHGHLDDDIMRLLEPCDEIWHAGDIGSIAVIDQLSSQKTLRCVWGNIDDQSIRLETQEELIFKIEGCLIYMRHIGAYPPNYNPTIRQKLDDIKPDIFVCGHSHILKVIYDKKRETLHLNPGACGKKGFHKIRTMLRFNIEGDRVQDMQVIELEHR